MNRATLAIALMMMGSIVSSAAAQDACMNMLEDCVQTLESREGACFGIALATGSADWRDMLATVLQRAATELETKGMSLSESTLRATQRGADIQMQVAAVREIAAVSKKLDARLAKGQKATRVDTVKAATPTSVAPPDVKQTVIKQQQQQVR